MITFRTENEQGPELYLYKITCSVVATVRYSPCERCLNVKTVQALAPGIGSNFTGGWAPCGDDSQTASCLSWQTTTSLSGPETVNNVNVHNYHTSDSYSKLCCKNWVVRYWHVCSEVQMICIWSSWCHCQPKIVKSRIVYLPGAGLPRLSWKKGR